MNLTGIDSEHKAASYLQDHGLVLLEKNHRSRFGEIDLIMRDGETLVFVEVRARARTDYGDAAASVTRQKQKKVVSAARHYLRGAGRVPDCRFDVVAFDGGGRIEWIRDAFGE